MGNVITFPDPNATDPWTDELWDLLRERSNSPDLNATLWDMHVPFGDGEGRRTPDEGFLHELSFAMAALETIAQNDIPGRHADEEMDGLDAFRMRQVAALGLILIRRWATARKEAKGDSE